MREKTTERASEWVNGRRREEKKKKRELGRGSGGFMSWPAVVIKTEGEMREKRSWERGVLYVCAREGEKGRKQGGNLEQLIMLLPKTIF